MHGVDVGNTRDLGKPMRSRRVRAQILEAAIEARVRLEDAACVSGASGAEQKDGCFFDAEHGGRVWLVERAPDAQRRPLDVATEDAAGGLGEARSGAGESRQSSGSSSTFSDAVPSRPTSFVCDS